MANVDWFKEINDGQHRFWHVLPDGTEVLDLLSNITGSGSYTPQGPTTAGAGGVTQGTDLGTTPITVQSLFDMIFYPAVAPSTTLAGSPAAGIYENGDTLSSVLLTSITTKGANPITSFILKKNGSAIFTDTSPSPTGGTETYTDSSGVSTNTTYQAIVSDGTLTGQATISYQFVSAYYWGVADAGLDISTDGGGLTKVVVPDSANISFVFNPTFPQVYYFAYPASYPALTSILDTNGFETISDWTVSTVSVMNSFGDVKSYRQYEFNNPTTTVNFRNTFIQ